MKWHIMFRDGKILINMLILLEFIYICEHNSYQNIKTIFCFYVFNFVLFDFGAIPSIAGGDRKRNFLPVRTEAYSEQLH